jgi:hypothetical protein
LIGDLVGAPTSGNALTSKSKVRCDISIANSLFLKKFSLIRVRKFPVPLHRGYSDSGETRPLRATLDSYLDCPETG